MHAKMDTKKGRIRKERDKGAESVLTSIQEEDILSFYAARVIFIA